MRMTGQKMSGSCTRCASQDRLRAGHTVGPTFPKNSTFSGVRSYASRNTSGQDIIADVRQESDLCDPCTIVRAATMFNVLDNNLVATPRRGNHHCRTIFCQFWCETATLGALCAQHVTGTLEGVTGKSSCTLDLTVNGSSLAKAFLVIDQVDLAVPALTFNKRCCDI